MYSRHGHLIPGNVPDEDNPLPKEVTPCPGFAFCEECQEDEAAWNEKKAAAAEADDE